jgi:hypothetical protein
MKLYCFLLVIILVFLVYDNKLYEGSNGQYDTGKDVTKGYKTGELDNEANRGSEFSKLFGGELPFIGEWIPTGDNIPDTTCSKYNDTDVCGSDGSGKVKHQTLISNQNSGWSMGGGHDASKGDKKKCMDCLKCKDNFAFIEPFYGHLCDAIAVCGDDDDTDNNNYIMSKDPYINAYNKTNWDLCDKKDCPKGATVATKETGSCLNPLQKLTCAALNDNTLLDTLLLVGKPNSIECSAEIEMQDIAN